MTEQKKHRVAEVGNKDLPTAKDRRNRRAVLRDQLRLGKDHSREFDFKGNMDVSVLFDSFVAALEGMILKPNEDPSFYEAFKKRAEEASDGGA